MLNYKCDNARTKRNGLFIGIYCTKDNQPCAYQRYCLTKKDVELTQGSQKCIKNTCKTLDKE